MLMLAMLTASANTLSFAPSSHAQQQQQQEMFSDMVSEWAVHQMVAWAMVLSGTVTLVSLLFVAAPYGRFSPDNKDAKADDAAGKAKAAAVTPVAPGSWGPLIPPRVAWIVMESPASLVSLALWVFAGDAQHCTSNPTNVVLLALFQLHYINRYGTSPRHQPVTRTHLGITVTARLTARCATAWRAGPSCTRSARAAATRCRSRSWPWRGSSAPSMATCRYPPARARRRRCRCHRHTAGASG